MTGATRRRCGCRAGVLNGVCQCGPAAVALLWRTAAGCCGCTLHIDDQQGTTFFFLSLPAGIIIAIMFACEYFILDRVATEDAWVLR